MEATIVSLAGYRDRQAEQAFRTRVHTQVDAFLEQWEAKMAEKSAPLSLLARTTTIRQERSVLTGAIVQAYVDKVYGSYLRQEQACCPGCGASLKARGLRPRTVETLVGPLTLARPYFYGSGCAQGFYPLDEALGLSGQCTQYDVQQAATELAVEMPYAEAARRLSTWTDAQLSDGSVHTLTTAVGREVGVLAVAPSAAQIQARIAQIARQQKWKPIVVLAIDGADVPTRPESGKGTRAGRKKVRARRARWKGEYRQGKGFRFFLVDEDRIVQLLSWHPLQTEEELGQALEQVKKAGLIPEDQVRLCAVADGDGWIWKWVEKWFPTARQLLDFYHCSGYLHPVAQSPYADEPLTGRQWLEGTMARLFCNQGEGVVWGLQRRKPTSPDAQAAIDRARTYLAPRLAQITYGAHRKGGYPIGAGAIESAHRFSCHVRLKRSGAWWYQENSNHLLALRCAKYNDTFDQVFEHYIRRCQTDGDNSNG